MPTGAPVVDAGNILVATTGVVSVGPTNAVGPATAVDTLDPLFVEMGYISEDGADVSVNNRFEEKSSWTSLWPDGFYLAESQLTVSCSLLQVNKSTVEFVHEATTTTNGTEWKVNPAAAGTNLQRSLVLDWQDGIDYWRMYIPMGVVVSAGESTVSRQGATMLPFVFGAIGPSPYFIFWNDSSAPRPLRPIKGVKQIPRVVNRPGSKLLISPAPLPISSQLTHTVDAVIQKDTEFFAKPAKGKKQNTTPQPTRGSQII